MNFKLKTLSPEAVARCLAKAERYRLLNEPSEAESICLDVLAVDAGNQTARITLLLALTDQFGKGDGGSMEQANRVLARLRGEYEHAYYAGVIHERWGKAQLRSGSHHGLASGFFAEAMRWYEKAMASSPSGNDDAILRWNACVRFLEQNPQLGIDVGEDASESGFPDGAPAR